MLDSNSIVDAMAKRQEEREKQQEVAIENLEAYKQAVNRIASMAEGKLLLQDMLKFSKLFADDLQLNPALLVELKGRQAYYKRLRPHLDKQLRMELENL